MPTARTHPLDAATAVNAHGLARSPTTLAALAALYFLASLAHFAHNAEYIAVYPGLPAWITRESVWLAWAGLTMLAVAGVAAHRLQRPRLAAVLLGTWGAFGLDGLLHYTLALCSAHTLATNATIWAESATGLALLATAAWSVRAVPGRVHGGC
jgi:hypothetical protein